MGVCGTAPGADWEAVRALHEAHGHAVVPSFGLHPWWIAGYLQQASLKQYDEQWTVELETLLRRYPAAHVGECGLDKAVLKDGVSYALQEEVMRRHMQLAGRYGRALTVHCVAGCWDRLLALLKAEQLGVDRYVKEAAKKGSQDALEGTSSMPTAIILHSCNTLPKDMMCRFMDVRNVYFSISGGGRAGQSAKTLALASAVPSDRLLLETDSPDQLPAALRGFGLQYNEPALLRHHCGILAAELGEPPAQLAKRTSDNAARAYQLPAATP
jgi:TatD DNase family protein